jgi:uncharacterized membrane protein YeaQ/YmgE (transglycosylase-associated protein family)
VETLWFILIGLAAGRLAAQFMGGGALGVSGDILLGVVGAVVGGFLCRQLGLSGGAGLIAASMLATIGAVILLFLVRPAVHGNRAKAPGLRS